MKLLNRLAKFLALTFAPNNVAPQLVAKMPFSVLVHQKCNGEQYELQSAGYFLSEMQARAVFCGECQANQKALCHTTVTISEFRNGKYILTDVLKFGPKTPKSYFTLT